MSRKYEGLVVLDTKGKEGSIEEFVSEVGKVLEANGATLDEVKQIGRKDFAYNARQIEGGVYVNYFFNASPEAVAEIKTALDLVKGIYMHQYRRIG
jgi:small subunit ribosomal protein S6